MKLVIDARDSESKVVRKECFHHVSNFHQNRNNDQCMLQLSRLMKIVKRAW